MVLYRSGVRILSTGEVEQAVHSDSPIAWAKPAMQKADLWLRWTAFLSCCLRSRDLKLGEHVFRGTYCIEHYERQSTGFVAIKNSAAIALRCLRHLLGNDDRLLGAQPRLDVRQLQVVVSQRMCLSHLATKIVAIPCL